MKNQTHVPAYINIYEKLRDEIIKGIYPHNSKLPSKRTLAEKNGVSTITVEHAYALLCDEGYVEARERSGYFVIFTTTDGFISPENKPVIFTSLTEGNDDGIPSFPFSVLTKTMRKVMTEYGENILDRSPNKGCIQLREAIRNYLAQNRGIIADTEQIIIGAGAEYLYGLVVDILGRNRIFGIEYPSYEKIEQVYTSSDVKCEQLPLGNNGIESTTLRSTKADVIHISPYRSFPTGVTADASKRHEYIRWADKGERYIIEDDFESEFSVSRKTEETVFALSDKENVIYINTFTKTISPSFRTGYMILPKKLIKEFEAKAGFYSCTVPTYIQFVLAQLISDGDFARHINKVRRYKRKDV